MSKAWLDAARRVAGVSIVGPVDINFDRVPSRAAEFVLDGARTSVSLEAMLDRSRPDLVFDAVVPAARLSVALISPRSRLSQPGQDNAAGRGTNVDRSP
jgi:predicted dehydrogenase